MAQIQRADPTTRRRLLIVLLVVLVVGGAVVWWLERWLGDLTAEVAADPDQLVEKAEFLLGVFVLAFTVPLLLGAALIWRLGTRVVAAQRFPPPGTKVVRDTPVVSGAAARRRGEVLRVCAAAVAVGAIAVPLMLFQLIRSLGAATP